MNDSTEKIGDCIKAARISARLSQKELASEVGVTTNFISQLETSRKSPSLSTMRKIAICLNVGTQELFGREPLKDELQDLVSKYGINNILSELKKMQY